MLNWIDYTIIGIIIFSAVVSVIRGFVREALSLVGWVCAFFVASQFYFYIADYFTYFHDAFIRNAVAIAILFIATLLVCSVVSYIISTIVDKTGLTGTDRVLGIFFGVVRGILIVSAILFFIDTFTAFSQNPDWQDSQLIPHFRYIIHWFFEYLQTKSTFLT